MKDNLISIYDCFDIAEELEMVKSLLGPVCVVFSLLVYTLVVSINI